MIATDLDGGSYLAPLRAGDGALRRYRRSLNLGSAVEAADALAAALSPSLTNPESCRVCAGGTPGEERIGALLSGTRAEVAQLARQWEGLGAALEWFRPVDWSEVEAAVRTLGDQLAALEFPAGAEWRPVPRGGYIALGLLASYLRTPRADLRPEAKYTRTLVLVDDLILTGRRMRRALAEAGDRPVVVAALFAVPAALQALREAETTVLACLYGAEVKELALPPHDRPGNGGYYAARSEHLCLPWNEPERGLWNAETGQWELAWPLLPAAARLRPETPAPTALRQPAARGPRYPNPEVLWVEDGAGITLGRWDTGETYGLREAGASFWRQLVTAGSVEAALASLAAEYAAPIEELARDLDEFATWCEAEGLLLPAGRDPGDG